MLKKNKKNQLDSGFTLIEMALVMVIGGVLLSFMGSALLTYLKKSQIDKTEYRMEAIKEALSQYLNVNRRYPCPARRDVAPGESVTRTFAVEASVACTGTLSGTVQTNATDPLTERVRIGSVPTRSLNLPDEMALDGWGNRFTYAVTINQASLTGAGSQYRNDGGALRIADSTGTVFVNNAHYVIFSHGSTGEGAYNLDGNLILPCNSGALDNENCNDTRLFMTTLLNSEADIGDFYDDYIYYQGQTMPEFDPVPSGAIMAFNDILCPTGWSEFTDAGGRVILGADNSSTPVTYPTLLANSNPVTATGTDVTVLTNTGTTSDSTDDTGISPYIALLYCKKD